MAEDKTKELLERLTNGIKETLDSEHYKAFLRVQSQFHSYSFNNAMLIYLQRPDATRVAGFNAWKKFERHVMKGEKGISILAPSSYKYEVSVDKIDPVTKQPVRDPATGKIQKENVTQEGRRFVKVSVFDIKQTEGKELPTICQELTGNSINSDKIIRSIKHISEVPIVEKEIESNAKGYYSRDENIIVVRPGMSLDQTAKTLIHELAHSKIHSTPDTGFDRATREVQAESVAYIVANRYGVDTSSYSFDYLASWSSNKELPELKKSFNLIQKTADDIIQKMDDIMPTIAIENSPVKIEIHWSESSQFSEGQMLDLKEANKLFEQCEASKFAERQAANDYIPYDKTKFSVHMPDGRVIPGQFDIGAGDFKDLVECIKKECGVNVQEYVTDNVLLEPTSVSVVVPVQDIRNQIIDMYSKEFPAIRHISEKTALSISDLNTQNTKPFSIKEIKKAYTLAGKKLEADPSEVNIVTFEKYKDVVDGIKQAQSLDRKAKAQEKALLSPTKSKVLEMAQ